MIIRIIQYSNNNQIIFNNVVEAHWWLLIFTHCHASTLLVLCNLPFSAHSRSFYLLPWPKNSWSTKSLGYCSLIVIFLIKWRSGPSLSKMTNRPMLSTLNYNINMPLLVTEIKHGLPLFPQVHWPDSPSNRNIYYLLTYYCLTAGLQQLVAPQTDSEKSTTPAKMIHVGVKVWPCQL